MTKKLKTPPLPNICQVTGNVSVPKIAPALNRATTIIKSPTIKIQINGMLFKMNLKSMLDSCHIVFKLFTNE